MTNDRKHPDHRDVGDPEVSATYREIAQEQAPEALNDAVLRQANASIARARPGTLRWLRPMAWAATIGLSLAIVLELSTVPVAPQQEFPQIAAPELPANLPRRQDEEQTYLKKDLAPIESAPAGSIATQAVRAEALSDDAEKRDSDHNAVANTAARMRPAADAPVASADAAFVADSSAINEAKAKYEIGEAQSGAYEAPAAAIVAEAEATEACDEIARATAETWLECILLLEEAGAAETALEQREQLREAFPDAIED